MKNNSAKPDLASESILMQYSCVKIVLYLFVFIWLCTISIFASASSVAVIYPEIRAPFNKIFMDIADGVERQVNGSTKRYVLQKNYSPQELELWLSNNDIKVCVALGVRAEEATSSINQDIPVILSGVLAPKLMNDSQPTISLEPSPYKLFKHIKTLNLNVDKIIVVYNPNNSEWLMRQARSAAAEYGLELTVYMTKSLSDSAKIYQKIFKRSDLKNTAIWLPRDPSSIDNGAVLAFILEQSWRQNTVVLSSNLAHVNKGVLFAMYPDNMQLGYSLGRVALKELNNDGEKLKSIIPVEDLKTAINRRTAEHLGISLTSAELRSYDTVFPSE